jgi:hypothetical protein
MAQQAEFWGDINLYKNINSKATLFGDAGPRFSVTNTDYYGFYIRPSLVYQIAQHIQAGGGIAWLYANVSDKSLHEARAWQGLRSETRVANHINWNNFVRLEERWFFESGLQEFRLRFRYFTGFTILLNHTTLEAKTCYLPIAFELFEDLNDHQLFINRTRIYSGLGYVVNTNNRIELFYIANAARKSEEATFDNVNVIRVRWHYTFHNK